MKDKLTPHRKEVNKTLSSQEIPEIKPEIPKSKRKPPKFKGQKTSGHEDL